MKTVDSLIAKLDAMEARISKRLLWIPLRVNLVTVLGTFVLSLLAIKAAT